VFGGLVGVPELVKGSNRFHHFLEPVIVQVWGHHAHHMCKGMEAGLMLGAIAVGLTGIFLAWRAYRGERGLATDEAFAARLPAVQRTLANKYYVDELYDATVIRGFWATCRALFRFDAGFIDGFLVNGVRNVTVELLSQVSGLFDKFVVDGLVNGVANTLAWGSRRLRRVQTGFVSNYALVLAGGMFVLVCAFLLLRAR